MEPVMICLLILGICVFIICGALGVAVLRRSEVSETIKQVTLDQTSYMDMCHNCYYWQSGICVSHEGCIEDKERL